MKLAMTLSSLLLLASLSASANELTENCDKLRDFSVSLTVKLHQLNATALELALYAEANGVQADTSEYAKAIARLSDGIDRLNYQINQICN